MRIAKLIFVNCLVMAFLLFLVLGALEVYLHVIVPGSSGGSMFSHTLDTKRYKVMKRNASIVAYGVELRTNTDGFRDHRPSFPPKDPGAYRVIVLGDSFTISAGVEYEQIWVRQLENRLKASMPMVEVFNLAVGGYNIIQYRLTLEEVGLELDPDLILIALYPANDFSNTSYIRNRRVAEGLEEPAVIGWRDRVHVYKVFLRPVANRLGRLFGPPPAPKPQEQVDDERNQNVAALHEIAGIARESGIQVEAVLLPSTWDNAGQRDRFTRAGIALEGSGIPYLDLLVPFKRSGVRESELQLNPIDAHPNVLYNSMVAEALTPHLLEAIGTHFKPPGASLLDPSE